MSAYIVTKEHILYLANAMLSLRLTRRSSFSYWNGTERIYVRAGDYEAAAQLGSILWQENVKSVNARYADSQPTEIYCVYGSELLPSMWQDLDPVQVIKACHCLIYQSCEHTEWKDSQACAIVKALIDCATRALIGYDGAAWGAPETTAAKAARIRAEMRPKIMAQLAGNPVRN